MADEPSTEVVITIAAISPIVVGKIDDVPTLQDYVRQNWDASQQALKALQHSRVQKAEILDALAALAAEVDSDDPVVQTARDVLRKYGRL